VRSDRWWLILSVALALLCAVISRADASDFRFNRDTFVFLNATVLVYKNGHAVGRRPDGPKLYTQRCFVMTRAALQFHKFARFDPKAPPLDDKALAARVRDLAHRQAWDPPLPAGQRVVFPGYANLRAMSKARGRVLQENIGLGWPTYLRVGNYRMFYKHDPKYQETTRADIDAALARNDCAVGYLSDYPQFLINHAVLIYAKKPRRAGSKIDKYVVYDPNHPEGPRELKWLPNKRAFDYQKDEEFPGGFTRVYQVYGKPWQ
jgi:hypothetical protein